MTSPETNLRIEGNFGPFAGQMPTGRGGGELDVYVNTTALEKAGTMATRGRPVRPGRNVYVNSFGIVTPVTSVVKVTNALDIRDPRTGAAPATSYADERRRPTSHRSDSSVERLTFGTHLQVEWMPWHHGKRVCGGP
jgi:hypothetical protein